MKYMIDVPSPYADLTEWESYLQSLLQIVPQTSDVTALVNEAREQITRLKSEMFILP